MGADNYGYGESGEGFPQMSRRRRRRDYFVMPGWGWAAVGVGCLLAGLALGWLIFRPKPTPDELLSPSPSSPTVIVRVVTATVPLATATAKPTNTPVFTPVPDTPTPVPTATPTWTLAPTATPTPELKIVVGGRVKVGDTGGANLRLRSGPGTKFVTFKIIDEGTELQVVGGPEEADDFVWWRLEDSLGVVGWAADKWLIPIP